MEDNRRVLIILWHGLPVLAVSGDLLAVTFWCLMGQGLPKSSASGASGPTDSRRQPLP